MALKINFTARFECHTFKRAICKSALIDYLQSSAYVDRFQSGAPGKCVFADMLQALHFSQGLQISAPSALHSFTRSMCTDRCRYGNSVGCPGSEMAAE